MSNPGSNLETRFFTFEELRAIEPAEGESGSPRLVGYAAVFNSLSAELRGIRPGPGGSNRGGQPIRFRERIAPGAFALSLASASGGERSIRALFEHDRAKLLGTQRNDTLHLAEDDRGLRVEIWPNLDTSHGRDAMALVQRGDITGMSFGFNIPEGGQRWQREGEGLVRELLAIELREVTVTSTPAYAEASLTLRSDDGSQQQLDELLKPEPIDTPRRDAAAATLRRSLAS